MMLLAATSVAAEAGRATTAHLFEEAAHRPGIATHGFILSDMAKGQAFPRRAGDAILVDRRLAALPRTKEEAVALVVLLETWVGDRPERLRVRNGSTAAEIGAGVLVGLAGAQLDKTDPREYEYNAAVRDRQSPYWDPRRPEYIDGNRVMAARAVTALDKVGGCSAPLVSLLTRMAGPEGASAGTQPFARMVLGNLGAAIYPPDRSCLRGD
jgi:hypothetical protein